MKKGASELVLSLFFVSDDVLWKFAEAIKAMGAEIGITNFEVIKKQILNKSSSLIKIEEEKQRQKGIILLDERVVAEIKASIVSSEKDTKINDGGYVN